MVRLYKRGIEKTSKHLNILNIIKRLNKVTMITYQTGQISNKSKWINKHCKYNIIDIDEETNSNPSSDSSDRKEEKIMNQVNV